MKDVTVELLRVSFKPKFVLTDLVGFVVTLVLILNTWSATQSDKGGKLLKAVGIVESRKGVFSLII